MTLKLLLVVMALCESGGDRYAQGKSGEVGILQITPIMVEEANRLMGMDYYRLKDRESMDESFAMATLYMKHYGPMRGVHDFENLSMRDCEILVRMWNGGPDGHTQLETFDHWEKVKEVLEARYLLLSSW